MRHLDPADRIILINETLSYLVELEMFDRKTGKIVQSNAPGVDRVWRDDKGAYRMVNTGSSRGMRREYIKEPEAEKSVEPIVPGLRGQPMTMQEPVKVTQPEKKKPVESEQSKFNYPEIEQLRGREAIMRSPDVASFMETDPAGIEYSKAIKPVFNYQMTKRGLLKQTYGKSEEEIRQKEKEQIAAFEKLSSEAKQRVVDLTGNPTDPKYFDRTTEYTESQPQNPIRFMDNEKSAALAKSDIPFKNMFGKVDGNPFHAGGLYFGGLKAIALDATDPDKAGVQRHELAHEDQEVTGGPDFARRREVSNKSKYHQRRHESGAELSRIITQLRKQTGNIGTLSPKELYDYIETEFKKGKYSNPLSPQVSPVNPSGAFYNPSSDEDTTRQEIINYYKNYIGKKTSFDDGTRMA